MALITDARHFQPPKCLKMVITYHSLTLLFWSCCPNPFTFLLVMPQQHLILNEKILGAQKKSVEAFFERFFSKIVKTCHL